MDPQILLFRRQYFQLFEPDFLSWPPKQLLRDVDVQEWLYNNLFDNTKSTILPADRYQFRVLKRLMIKIEAAVEDPEQDEISDNLMNHLSELVSANLPSADEAVQQRSYVTFSCLSPSSNISDLPDQEPTITLLERRNLISGSGTTGFRTWEAALHFGTYLLSNETSDLVRDKNVFELGVGTGFISILCAKHLGAKHVTATDGDEGVIEAFKENLFLNGLDEGDRMNASVLRWGHGLKGSWVEDDCESWPYDIVLGTDITYDRTAAFALAATIANLFELRPHVRVLIAGAVRNADTFETFRQACLRKGFTVAEIEFAAKPMREQIGLFYATAVPLRILSITKTKN